MRCCETCAAVANAVITFKIKKFYKSFTKKSLFYFKFDPVQNENNKVLADKKSYNSCKFLDRRYM